MRHRFTSHKKRNNRKKIVLSCIGIFLVGIGVVLVYQSRQNPVSTNTEPSPTLIENSSINSSYETVVGRYLFTGTIVPARGVEQQARRSDGTYDFTQPFSKLNTLDPDKYDAWITDLECPITDANLTFRQQVETLIFNCRTGFLDPIVQYFEFINLANNHTGDLGSDAFIETQAKLDSAGAQIFGHYDPSQREDTCEIVGLPVRVVYGDEDQATEARLPVAMCAWHYFTQSPKQEELDVMNQYADIVPVFAFTHAGIEYVPKAQASEISLARSLVDRGAEFVINNNPHWVQNTEVYKDTLIVYSTGNFMFDQLDEETNRAANLDVTIEVPYSDNVEKWLELGDECLARNDNCLTRANELGLEKIDINYSFDVIASLNGYRELTRKADPATQTAVEERMNWSQSSSQLGQN